jgi:hypothetical protein
VGANKAGPPADQFAMDFAEHAHARSVEEVAAHFGVSLDTGLDEIAVAAQRAKHGRNELPVDEGAFFSP